MNKYDKVTIVIVVLCGMIKDLTGADGSGLIALAFAYYCSVQIDMIKNKNDDGDGDL